MTPESILQFPHSAPPPGGEGLEVAPGILWLRMPLPFSLDHINLWALEDLGGWTLVDCGLGDDTTRALWEAFFSGHGSGFVVRRVIATHHHPDHAGNAGWMTARFGVNLWMAQAEFLMAHAIRERLAGTASGELVAMFARNGLDPESVHKLAQRGNMYRQVVPEFPATYKRLMDGQSIAIGRHTWRAIMGYGHAPEHVALYCEQAGLLISGDMVLPKITTNVSVWSVEPEGNPLALFLESIRRYARLPADTLILPSHGLPFRGLRERISQLEEHHALRLAEVHEACLEPRSAADILPTLFRRELDFQQLFFAMGESMAHLHFLHGEGRLTRRTGADGIIRYVQC